jgi:hypothetical protein
MENQYITVDKLCQDGIGSLMEYILGAVFVGGNNKLSYAHTDLKIIEHNKDNDKDWLNMWNAYIRDIFLPNVPNVVDIKGDIVNTIKYMENMSLKKILDTSQYDQKHLRCSIIDHYHKMTESIEFPSDIISIAVHIRIYMNSDCDPHPYRQLYQRNNSTDIFFQQIIKNLLNLAPKAQVHIYTQAPIELFKHFYIISPNITIHTDNNAINDLLHMSKATILVMSKGSYSRLANFYSKGLKIIREGSIPILSENTLHIPSSGVLSKENQINIKTYLKNL